MDTPRRATWPAVAYSATILLSAFLLFQIQPLVSKAILPRFGGSPAVWTTCLLFFQTLLFAGYAYAHWNHAWLRPKHQAIFHIAILLLALGLLKVLPGSDSGIAVDRDPAWNILLLLSVTIGVPYFVLAATGPLLQAWFGRTFPGHPPYRLYALSNLGSLLALLSYPFFIERMLDLPQQAFVWSCGFVIFALLCAAVAATACRSNAEQVVEPTSAEVPKRPKPAQYASWLAWPAFGSIVLMSTTNHVSIDVAAMPFLWVVPLSLYLITFIIAFDRPQWHRPALVAALTLVAIYGSALVYREDVGRIYFYDCGMTGRCAQLIADAYAYDGKKIDRNDGAVDAAPPGGPSFRVGFLPFIVLNFAAMFGICLLCHGELARQRPHQRYLTIFYLMIAAGGALGGAAVSLAAPHVFETYFEWKLAMFVAAIAALGLILHHVVNRAVRAEPSSAHFAWMPTLLLVGLLFPTSFVLLDLVEYLHAPKKGVQLQSRNFFGALTIRERNPNNPQTHNLVLLHGATVHGSQFVAPDRRGQPTTYYSTPSGIGLALKHYRAKLPEGGLHIGAVGLGTGTLAAYAGYGDKIRYYEIDPAVIEIASTGKWFTYLADSRGRGAEIDIQLGDARLTLARESRGDNPLRYHLLVIDAFSGDAIPLHLLTQEAFELYFARLAAANREGETGALAVHVSNRYLDLERVVRGIAERKKIPMVHIHSPRVPSQSINSADWIILTRDQSLLDELSPFVDQDKTAPKPAIFWTDARSSLFDALK